MIYGPYHATVLAVHDGDTVNLQVDLGFDLTFASSCRIYGINAPELKTTAGKEAREFARSLLKTGDKCRVLSHGWDKYGGRFDGTVILSDNRVFATVMLEAGHAVKMKRPRRPPGVTD